ncbi:PAS domain S-box protein [Sphingomonas xinjiangensis]|uniref:histidine kinase n=1 Tax=Sphingomonas xinjiangensis TaxID=643568 RepID=A0A840YSH8_9SPHN|nr:PAS domain S-box protein [Sphingomonas xinjiangensis]MBB5712649.1 PAS domain S-box-containing protein [Sphingomonas xinjiangensis]
MLATPEPASILWGADRIQLYNDPYILIAAERHPRALGEAAAENWSEAYGDFLGPILDRVFAGETVVVNDFAVPLRTGRGDLEERFFTGHFLPITDDLGGIEGVFHSLTEVTATVRAAAQLRQGDARYRALFEQAAAGFAHTDLLGRFTEVNDRFCQITGYTRDALLNIRMQDITHPDDLSANMLMFEAASANGETFEIEKRYRRPDGSTVWVRNSVAAMREEGGRIKGTLAVSVDIGDQKKAEQALKASEARLRFFGELEKRLFSSADAFDAMLGAAEMLGRKLNASRCAYADVAADGDRFWIRSDYNAPGLESSVGAYSLDLFGPRAATDLRAGRALVVCDVTDELAPGEGREMFQAIAIDAIICCPLVKEGRLTAMMAVHQDQARFWTADEISLVKEVVERCWAHVERVGAEARLRESEERLRLAVDNAEVGFWDVDLVSDTLIWPPATKAMFGISADVPVTMHDFYEGLHPDDREATSAAFAAAADPDQRALYDVEYRTVGKEDAVVRWVAAKGRGLFDAAGRCLRVAGTAVQITARKEAEEALRDLNATLEARIATAVAEREEAQEALRQSQKMEAMGQLTGGVAHDFNNLLTPIVGSLDMLQRKGLGGEREQRLIAGAVQSAERARTLVQRLLAFARRQPLQPVPVDVSKLVAGMGDLVSSTTGPQIKVVVETADDLPPAKADPNQLEMALLNLAVNARDAMSDGGTLRISASRESIRPGHRSRLRTGHYIRLSVADTGIGMDEATLARAVEPFFSTKGIGKGTGLGLSMVHGLASQLGGALTIQSRPELGTNVELWLPQSAIAPDSPQLDSEAAIPTIVGIALLVDDEELVRMSTGDMLHDLGYTVIEASSGEEAMLLIEAETSFDLLVTDHLMPGMNGTDLALAARTLRPGLPVLVVSGYAENEGVDPRLSRLAKPFRKDELAASLAQL